MKWHLGQRVVVHYKGYHEGKIIGKTIEQHARYDVRLDNGTILQRLVADDLGELDSQEQPDYSRPVLVKQ